MSASTEIMPARAEAREEGKALEVTLGGDWQLTEPRPAWRAILGGRNPERVRLKDGGLGTWDCSLALFVFEAQKWCRATGSYCELEALPPKLQMLAGQLDSAEKTSVPFDRTPNFLIYVGNATTDTLGKLSEISHFVGECVLAANQALRVPAKFRWRDCLREMQQCGAMALPIVSLISFLVGVTLAYVAAVLLRQFGADIYVADLIGKAMLREMGALMTAVVLSGRTGAAFAATLGNMRANEEIDALETLGIAPVQFLVLPRMLALALMMPLLALYSNALGIIGGMVVAAGLLDIPPTAYWVEMLTVVTTTDIWVGLIKASTFGFIIGLAGCLRGLQAERSAAGVGHAATSAVVTSVLFITIADAIFAVLFNAVGW